MKKQITLLVILQIISASSVWVLSKNYEITQMTIAENLEKMDHLPQFKTLWYLDGKELYSLNTSTLQSNKVHKIYKEQISPAHQNIFKDNKHWIVDLYNNEEPLLVLFSSDRTGITQVYTVRINLDSQ